ncbi:MAG: mechanosensitive ion channel domain-containing protein [Pseudomonadota bacterium]
MAETRIEIVVTGDNAEAVTDAIAAGLPEGAAVDAVAVAPVADPTLGVLIGRGAVDAAELPAVIATWWRETLAGEGLDPVTGFFVALVIVAIAYGIERLVAPRLAGWPTLPEAPEPGRVAEGPDMAAAEGAAAPAGAVPEASAPEAAPDAVVPGAPTPSSAPSPSPAPTCAPSPSPSPVAEDTAVGRMRAAAAWGIRQAVLLTLFYALVLAGNAAVFNADAPAGRIADAILDAGIFARIWIVIIAVLAAPGAPGRRVARLSDAEGLMIAHASGWLIGLLALADFVTLVITDVIDAGPSGALAASALSGVDGLLLIAYFLYIREPIARLIGIAFLGGERPEGLVGLIARHWYVLYGALALLQTAAQARGYLAPLPGGESFALRRSFSIFVLMPFVLASVGILRVHWRDRLEGRVRGRVAGFLSLAEGMLVIAAAVAILYAWDLDPFATGAEGAHRLVPGLVSAAIVVVVGIAIWRVVSALLAPQEKEVDEDALSEAEEGGPGGSRFETVLPILRGFAAALVGAITVMVALSSVGVQIGPLIAGAGIVGLAVGFGAQKMVEDVISGILYLTEDAFRMGEYIETAQGKGMVEKIMLRSVRLRHHRGPIFTIPFSQMGTIQNHSRDWVKVKFTFEVGPREDVERVRKLIKKLGQQLSADPELEGKFLEPLKSQGALAMVGPNYQIGVKFTCKPGQQFLIRRKAMAAIQKAVEEQGIQIAIPRVLLSDPEMGSGGPAAAGPG